MSLRIQETLQSFLDRPETKPYEEWIHGETRSKTMPSFPHSVTQVQLARKLDTWTDVAGGTVLTEQRCVLKVGADTYVLLPDVSYFPRGAFSTPPSGAVDSPPLLAVEILSPDDVYGRVQDKVLLYLSAGVTVVWIVDPVARNVTIFRSHAAPLVTDQRLADPILPGLEIDLPAMFAKIDG